MNMPRLFFALCLAVLAVPALAASKTVTAVPAADADRADLVTLLLPVSLDVELVDGLEYPALRSMFRRGDLAVRMLPGEREVALRYNQLFQLTADDHEIVRSGVMVLRFVAEPGQTYRAEHPAFRDVSAAREGVKNFELRIIDEAGSNRVSSATQVRRNWRGEQSTTARPDLVSSEAARAAAKEDAGNVARVPAAASAGGVNALDLLKFTWQNATAGERAAFMVWAQDNP